MRACTKLSSKSFFQGLVYICIYTHINLNPYLTEDEEPFLVTSLLITISSSGTSCVQGYVHQVKTKKHPTVKQNVLAAWALKEHSRSWKPGIPTRSQIITGDPPNVPLVTASPTQALQEGVLPTLKSTTEPTTYTFKIAVLMQQQTLNPLQKLCSCELPLAAPSTDPKP